MSDERMDPVQHIIDLEDEAERHSLALAGIHDSALLAFSTNFELVKKLAHIIGWENVPAEGQKLLWGYLSNMVDGADGYVGQAVAQDGTTTELVTLFREINDARDWLAAHMETE